MFNLDIAINQWRRQMAAHINSPETLDELESHLREEFAALSAAGASGADAFQSAAARVGYPGAVAAEFRKMVGRRPLAIGAFAWGSSVTVLAAVLVSCCSTGSPDLLLYTHVFILTAGYAAALLAGSFGLYGAACRWFLASSPPREEALSRAVLVLTRFATALAWGGLALGIFWSGNHRGRYWTGDPREVGTGCACLWLLGFWAVQQLRLVSDRATLLLAIGGNLLLALAWFGAGNLAQGHPIGSLWPLNVFLGLHLLFLALWIVPTPEAAEA